MTLMGNVPPLDPGLRGIPEANYAAAWQALETAGSHPLILSLAGATTTGVTPANISAIARAALDFHRKRGKPVRRPAPPSAAALPTQPPMARVRRCRPPPSPAHGFVPVHTSTSLPRSRLPGTARSLESRLNRTRRHRPATARATNRKRLHPLIH